MSVSRETALTTRVISVIGIIVVVLFSAKAYIVGGLTEVSTFGSWISQAIFFSIIATALFIIRSHAERIRDRRPRWQNSLLLLGSIAFFLIWKFSGEPSYSEYFSIIASVGRNSVSALVGYSYLSSMYRFRTNTWEKTVMAITAVICIVTVSPLIPIFIPGTEALFVWLLNYPAAAVTNALWTTIYIGLAALLARVFLGKEKLSALGE